MALHSECAAHAPPIRSIHCPNLEAIEKEELGAEKWRKTVKRERQKKGLATSTEAVSIDC